MVRVTHDGVSYFPQGGPLMPGATTAAVTVYDTAKKVEPLSQTVEVDRYQSEDGKQLQVIALFAIQNASNPPRTMDCRPHLRVRAAGGSATGFERRQGAGRAADSKSGERRPGRRTLMPSTSR